MMSRSWMVFYIHSMLAIQIAKWELGPAMRCNQPLDILFQSPYQPLQVCKNGFLLVRSSLSYADSMYSLVLLFRCCGN